MKNADESMTASRPNDKVDDERSRDGAGSSHTNDNRNDTTASAVTNDTSPEAAGVVRGATRTAFQSIFSRHKNIKTGSRSTLLSAKKNMKIIKSSKKMNTHPLVSKSTSIVAPSKSATTVKARVHASKRTSAASATTKGVPTVAQVTDQMSRGLDLVSVAIEQQELVKNTTKGNDSQRDSQQSPRTDNQRTHSETHEKRKRIEQKQHDQSQKNRYRHILFKTLHEMKNVPLEMPTRWRHYGMMAWNFSSTMVKNTLLGTISFESYDSIIHYFDARYDDKVLKNENVLMNESEVESNSSDDVYQKHQPPYRFIPNSINIHPTIPSTTNNTQTNLVHVPFSSPLLVMDSYARTTILQHCLAGAFSGFVYAFSLSLWDGVYSLFQRRKDIHENRSLLQMTFPSHFTRPILHSFTPSAISNCMSTSLLYGSYEYLKRTLSQQMTYVPLQRNKLSTVEGTEIDKISSDVIVIGLAGGIAGQLQHLASHVMDHWKELESIPSQPVAARSSLSQPLHTLSDRLIKLSPPWKSNVFAFVSSSIGFLAFEYGKDLISPIK